MFAFSQIDPETTGSVSEMPVPSMDYLTEGVKGAFWGTLGRIYDYRTNVEELADTDTPLLSAEEANRDYPIPEGWDEPVHESYANYRNSRSQKQQAQAFYLNSKQNVAVQGLGFVSSMVSGMLNPVDLALMFVPVVGRAPVLGPYPPTTNWILPGSWPNLSGAKLIEAEAMYAGALGRGARFRETINKGLVTDYRLQQIFGKHAGLADSTVQGAAFGVMVEPINRHIANSFNEDAGNPLLNIGEMTLGAAGMHALFRGLGRVWARLSDDSKLQMMVKGVDDFVKGKDTDIATIAKTDVKWAEEQVRLKEELESLTEMVMAREDNPHHVQIAKDLDLRYDGVQALIPGQFMAVYTKMDGGNPFTVYMPLDATRAEVKARLKEKIAANKPEPTFEQKIKDIFASKLEAFRKEILKPGEKPVVPETGGSAEQVMYSSVLDEIRQKNLRTKEQIQQNFPLAQLSREEAAVLRRSAWNEAEVKAQHEQNLQELVNQAVEKRKGAKAEAKRKMVEDMPTPPGLKVEETQHDVLKPEDKTIAPIEEQTKKVEKKVVEKIKKKATEPNTLHDKMMGDIGLQRQRGPLGKKGYFTTNDPAFVGLSIQITKDGIHLNNIQRVKEDKYKGVGEKKIRELQKVADDLGLPITLTAEPLAKHIKGAQESLEAYYEKLGFKRIKGNEFKYEKSTQPKIDWELFNENLVNNLDSFNPSRDTGTANFVLNDIADAFVTFAKSKPELSILDALKAFRKESDASKGNLTKLASAVKDEFGKLTESLSQKRVRLEKEKAAGTIKPEDAKALTDLEKKQDATKESFQKAFMEQLKKEGEARIKALKEAADANKPIPEVIKTATDCLGGII